MFNELVNLNHTAHKCRDINLRISRICSEYGRSAIVENKPAILCGLAFIS